LIYYLIAYNYVLIKLKIAEADSTKLLAIRARSMKNEAPGINTFPRNFDTPTNNAYYISAIVSVQVLSLVPHPKLMPKNPLHYLYPISSHFISASILQTGITKNFLAILKPFKQYF